MIPRRANDAAILDPSHPFRELKRRIIERTGHFYYDDKDDLLWERVQRRMAAVRAADAAAYRERLDGIDSEREWAALEAEITVGETFFFRYAEQFAALRETILPELLKRRAQSKRLRIWSAGCANGSEPYSVAILLSQMLGERLPDWRISILGTDINQPSLDTAKAGVFGKWALRALKPEDQHRWFDAEDKGRWRLKGAYRSLVRFERANLLTLLTGDAPLEWSEFDLILCRNVLIYFHPTTVDALVEAMGERMAGGGWLLVGHAEPSPNFARSLEPVSLPGTAAYRRPAEGETYEPPATPTPFVFEPPAPLIDPPAPPAPSAPAKVVQPAAPPPSPATTSAAPLEQTFAAIQTAADAGRYDAALALSREAISERPEAAELHFIEGVVLYAVDRMEEAEKALRRALYLNREFALAHYHLGLLLAATGRKPSGRRSLATAAKIAGTLSSDARLTAGSGLTAGALRTAARAQLESVTGG
ncbi:CheR family methyltransferase [Caulobacter segnis]|uniref:CheR family methyltransferase n=1 Tax=Caulobacter segnis TaxID=88688 RepID=UPI00240F64CB|nr:CheR family methyltransferase [Caulobacter segnis]MDG2521007.1 CheR family methyltransferase [Caulobacter segnis]